MITKKVTCVICPKGCDIEVKYTVNDKESRVVEVTGHSCERGYNYAVSEVVSPVRTLTSTVKLVGGGTERLAVKSAEPLPREKLFECMAVIRKAQVISPVKMGDVIIENIAETGVDIIAACDG